MAGEDRKLRVLVVDDHDVVQWGFRLLLERQSWVERCFAARTGAEAVELCRRERAANLQLPVELQASTQLHRHRAAAQG